jgi:hypothetical protein
MHIKYNGALTGAQVYQYHSNGNFTSMARHLVREYFAHMEPDINKIPLLDPICFC